MLYFFFLQGGDPLEFKYGNTASVSVQSTSPTDQQPDQFVTRYFSRVVIVACDHPYIFYDSSNHLF